jgi:hypothetical protein
MVLELATNQHLEVVEACRGVFVRMYARKSHMKGLVMLGIARELLLTTWHILYSSPERTCVILLFGFEVVVGVSCSLQRFEDVI